VTERVRVQGARMEGLTHFSSTRGAGGKVKGISGLSKAAVAAAMMLCISSARAALTTEFSTDFNAPTYSDGTLVTVSTATDTTTPGQNGWLNTSAGLTNPIQVSNTATNGIVSMTTSGQDVRHALTDSITSGSLYLDADFNVSAAG